MARPKATIPTERLCVTVPAGEVKAAKKAATAAGVTWADFVRQALLSQAAMERGRPVAGEGESVQTPAPSRPEPVRERTPGLAKALAEMTPAEIRAAATPVEQHALHEHVAGKATPSGVHPCSVKGCAARKVGGRWVEVRAAALAAAGETDDG